MRKGNPFEDDENARRLRVLEEVVPECNWEVEAVFELEDTVKEK